MYWCVEVCVLCLFQNSGFSGAGNAAQECFERNKQSSSVDSHVSF